jgi:hypothetical protein
LPTAPSAAPARTGRSTADVARALGLDRSASELVRINRDRVELMARHILASPEFTTFSRTTWDDRLFWNVEDPAADRSQLFAVGNAINFRYWCLDGHRAVRASGTIDGRDYRGAMYMWRSLRRALDRGVPVLDAAFLAELSARDFNGIFADDHGINPLDVARDDRISNLRDLGSRLLADWDGSFFNLVGASNGSLVEFAGLAGSFRAFDDPLFKLSMVNAIMHGGSGVYEFRDEPLPAIDYHLVRHALRQGLIEAHPSVAQKLIHGLLLSRAESYELRRVALVAFVDLADLTGISGEIIDNKYWLNRVNCTDTEPVCLRQDEADRCPFLGACIRSTAFGLPLELTRYY